MQIVVVIERQEERLYFIDGLKVREHDITDVGVVTHRDTQSITDLMCMIVCRQKKKYNFIQPLALLKDMISKVWEFW